MARLDAKWYFWRRGQTWYHFWQDTEAAGGVSEISGSTAGTSTVTGSLSGSGSLAGSSAGTSTAVGVLIAYAQISGQADGIADVSATITGTGELRGGADGLATVTGTITDAGGGPTPITGGGGSPARRKPNRGSTYLPQRNFEVQRENDKRMMKIFEAFLNEV